MATEVLWQGHVAHKEKWVVDLPYKRGFLNSRFMKTASLGTPSLKTKDGDSKLFPISIYTVPFH